MRFKQTSTPYVEPRVFNHQALFKCSGFSSSNFPTANFLFVLGSSLWLFLFNYLIRDQFSDLGDDRIFDNGT